MGDSSWLRSRLRYAWADPMQRHRCEKCRARFLDTDPGAWTWNRSDEFPELCRCSRKDRARGSHTNCDAFGPYCPRCAARIEQELLRLREMYRD